MFDAEAQFAGITLTVDPIDRTRTDESDNVMAMFYEEQPFMWEYTKGVIAKTIASAKGAIDFLDVGTGSGVWSILVGKHTKAKNILAIDKSPRAVQEAKKNGDRNGVSFSLQQEFYNMNSAPFRSAKVIGLYPPYHLYPPEIETKIPQHARGGVDGQQIFKEQLCVANYHLAEGGIIVFNQMCLGKDGKPAFESYIPHLIDGASLTYTNIFQPMSTKEFLSGVYGNDFVEYQEVVSNTYPELYYCDGIITRDGKGSITVVEHEIDARGRSWKDRIELHRQIALHRAK